MGNSLELHSVNGNNNANEALEKSPHHTETEISSVDQRDAQALARLGKKPVLKVCLKHRTRHVQDMSLKVTAAVLLFVYPRLYMHHLDHMGRGANVSYSFGLEAPCSPS